MGFFFDQLNYFDLARDLDFVSYDVYPRTEWHMAAEVDPSTAALAHDTMRGLKHKNHWVMEQQSGPGGWENVSVMPRPGEIRLWAYQSIAHGADAIIYFRWRTARFGTEEYWHGILDHHAQPGRRYAEVKRMGEELSRIGDLILGSQVQAPVAFINSYDTHFAFEIQHNNPQFAYNRHYLDVYRALHRRNPGIDVVAPLDDLAGYRIVAAPALHVLPAEVAENLIRFVENGGTLLLTARTGVKDPANAVVNMPLPGLLAELCGVQVDEYDSFPADYQVPVMFCQDELSGRQANAAIWADVLRPSTATTIAEYAGEFYAGKPAITLNRYGKGNVVYVGTLGDRGLFDTMADWLLSLGGVEPRLTPGGVEITERWKDGKRIMFILNHAAQDQTLWLDRSYKNLLGEGQVQGEIVVPGYEVFVLAEG
jgi:beta-galactosidase